MTNKTSNQKERTKLGAEGIAWLCFALLILAFGLYISHLV